MICTNIYLITNCTITIVDHETKTTSKELHRSINLQVRSSRDIVTLEIDNLEVYNNTERGIHLLVLNQATANIMVHKVYDTYSTPYSDETLITFIKSITNGRILILAIKDEGSLYLSQETRIQLFGMGSKKITDVSWRDTWAIIFYKNGNVISESHSTSPRIDEWAPALILTNKISLQSIEEIQCKWHNIASNVKLKKFCNNYEGFGQLCDCSKPMPLKFLSQKIKNNNLKQLPIIIITSDRPHYLYRHFTSLLSSAGVNPDMITVFIDGFSTETRHLSELFGLKAVHHLPVGISNYRVSQHYKFALKTTFQNYPEAKYVIILEDDLDVSPDLFNYFSQTLPLLENEDVYCISAWNDLGYKHTSNDPTALYRIESMPGLGWILKRQLFIEEFEKNWPQNDLWDWDLWMRSEPIRKGRECIIPDVPRTFHFGSFGVHIDPFLQKTLFNNHNLQMSSPIKLQNISSLTTKNYEIFIEDMLTKAIVLNHNKSLCDPDFIPDTKDKTYVAFIRMDNGTDFLSWLTFAQCNEMWYYDARGYHKSMWRLWIQSNHVIIIGYPASPYSKFKPSYVKPFFL